MLLFQWETIDWEKWMPLEVAVLLVLILFIRILRRFRRWSAVRSSHVSVTPWDWNSISGYRYIRQLDPSFPFKLAEKKTGEIVIKQFESSSINPSEGRSTTQILYIHSLCFHRPKYHPIPSSLALMGHNVISLTPSAFYSLISEKDNAENNFFMFLQHQNISTIIAFDHALAPLLDLLSDSVLSSSKTPLISPPRLIFIRPTGSWDTIKSAGKLLFHPLQLFTRLKLTHLQRKYSTLTTLRNNVADSLDLPIKFAFRALAFIFPKKSWQTQEGAMKLQQWEEYMMESSTAACPVTSYHFTQGDWWFYRNETVVLGLLSQFLSRDTL